MENQENQKKIYESPKIKELGKIGEVTNSGQQGSNASDNVNGYAS